MTKSEHIFQEACQVMPGGVNSPVRAYRAVGLTPRFIDHAKGAYIYDIDGNSYIDYVGSWGPMILGHAREKVVEAVCEAARRGTSYGAPTCAEVEIAEMINEAVSCSEMVRLVNSGTEAVMSAIRAARGYTGRDYIVKFEGCYHGHSDGLLVKGGSGLLTENVPDSAGVPAAFVEKTLVAKYNDADSVSRLFDAYPGKIADMVTLGKIIGGGMPMAAYCGRKEIMSMVSPSGPVYQAGTLSGNPAAVAAGLATLKILRKHQDEIYPAVDHAAKALEQAYTAAIEKYHIPASVNRTGSLLSIFFTNRPVESYDDAVSADLNMFKRYFAGMLSQGIYLAPSQFEAVFVGYAHGPQEIEKTKAAIDTVLGSLAPDRDKEA